MTRSRRAIAACALPIRLLILLCLVLPGCKDKLAINGWAQDQGGSTDSVAEAVVMLIDDRPAALPDKGIWPDLDPRVSLRAPEGADSERTSIVVDKPRRVLSLLDQGVPIVSYPVALGFDPVGDKQKQGDGRTPEGMFYLCENLHRGLAPRYGARSMRLSYPNAQDAARGLAEGLITEAQKRAIERAIAVRQTPPQNTRLGSSIRIHGGGIGKDWTLGCIALRDPDVIDLYASVKTGTAVEVLGTGDAVPYGDLDADGIPNQVDGLLGAKKAALNAARYDGRYLSIPSRMGDVPREIGVCTDVIVRSMRNAGLDLQAQVQRDRAQSPSSYPRIQTPDSSIDHRRVKNLVAWFGRHWQPLPLDDPKTFLPGDVIFMDTLLYEGPDHCGIISDRKGASGWPLVINNWSVGYRTSEMDLLGVVPVLRHYRWKN